MPPGKAGKKKPQGGMGHAVRADPLPGEFLPTPPALLLPPQSTGYSIEMALVFPPLHSHYTIECVGSSEW